MRTGSYSLEPARSYPPEARRSSSERSSALRPPGERSRPSQREFPKPVREQQPDSSAPELPLLAEMCNTGSQLVKKSRALFSQLQKLGSIAADWRVRSAPTWCSFPSSKSWAPLRSVPALVRSWPPPLFSQLQKLGSIAAAHVSSDQGSSSGFSQLQKLGSIAAQILEMSQGSKRRFSQLQKLGSIAAYQSLPPQRSHPPFSQLQKLGSIAAFR